MEATICEPARQAIYSNRNCYQELSYQLTRNGRDFSRIMAIGFSQYHAKHIRHELPGTKPRRCKRIATRITLLMASALAFMGIGGAIAYASGTEGTGSGATADAPGNISFTVPTETILGVSSDIAIKGGSSFIGPSNWVTSNAGQYPISITDIKQSNMAADSTVSYLGTTSTTALTSANGEASNQLHWDLRSGFNNKNYSKAGGQLVIPSGNSVQWNWAGEIVISQMGDAFRLDLSNGMAKLCDVTFTYRAIMPLTGNLTITQGESNLSNNINGGIRNTNSAGLPNWQWYLVNKDGSESKLDGRDTSTLNNGMTDYAGKTLRARISDSSYWTTGTLESAPYYVPDKFAIYSSDDNSLIFYDRGGVPSAGDTFNGRKVTAIYTRLTNDKLALESMDNQPWADVRSKIRTISFADKYTPSKCAYWFDGCSNLSSIDFTNFSFGDVTTSASMFNNCTSLKSANAAKLDVSSLQNANGMFNECSSLTTLDVSNWNVSKLWNTGAMFKNCSALASLNLTKWNTSSLVISYSMFQNCKSLGSIGDTTNWSLSAVTNPTYMFSDCQSLTNLNTLNWSMKSANDLQYMFYDCFKLGNVDVSKWDVSNATNLEWLFNKCYKMTGINVSKWNVSKVTSMQGTFANMTSLQSVDVSGWDVSNVIDLSYMFNHDSTLKSIEVNKWNVSKNKTLSLTFMGCTNLSSLDISKWNVTNCESLNYTFGECPNITSIDVSQWNVTNNKIFYRMFYQDKALTSLDISKWKNSVATNWIDFTNGCENIKELDMSGIDNSNAGEYCGGVFINMPRLEKIVLGSGYRFTTRDSYPEETSSKYIDGADGKWYAESTGAGYEHENIPVGKADTYYANTKNENLQKEAFAVYSADDNSLDFYKRAGVPVTGSQFNGKTATYVLTNIETISRWSWDSTIKSNVTAANVIDNNIKIISTAHLFESFTNMITCNITQLDVSNVTNMEYMFDGCSKLATLDVSKFDTSKVTRMGAMFYGCSKLTALDVSRFDTTKVTDMGGMFGECTSLTTLDISGFDTARVTNMNSMFSGCSKITALDVSGFDTTKVTNMNSMFFWDSKLTALNVSGFDTTKVTNMNSMFSGCSKITALDVSGFDTSNVTNMSGMFSGCSKLAALDVSGFDTTKVTSMSCMFDRCASLAALDVSRFDTTKVTNMNAMFDGCSKLAALDVSGFNTAKVTDMSGMFYGCSKLTALDISRFNTATVTDMNCMFCWCSSLAALDVSKFDTSKVTNMMSMFSECSNLAALDVSKFDTSKVTNMGSMFYGCSKLTALDISGFDTTKVTSIDSMFGWCSSLKKLTLGIKWNIETYPSNWLSRSSNPYYWYAEDGTAYYFPYKFPNGAGTYRAT